MKVILPDGAIATHIDEHNYLMTLMRDDTGEVEEFWGSEVQPLCKYCKHYTYNHADERRSVCDLMEGDRLVVDNPCPLGGSIDNDLRKESEDWQ